MPRRSARCRLRTRSHARLVGRPWLRDQRAAWTVPPWLDPAGAIAVDLGAEARLLEGMDDVRRGGDARAGLGPGRSRFLQLGFEATVEQAVGSGSGGAAATNDRHPQLSRTHSRRHRHTSRMIHSIRRRSAEQGIEVLIHVVGFNSVNGRSSCEIFAGTERIGTSSLELGNRSSSRRRHEPGTDVRFWGLGTPLVIRQRLC